MATHQHDETVAVLGAGGIMGLPMARNLARAGVRVRAWNRSRDKAEPLADDGATVADTPADAAEGATVVLTMVADADAVLDVARPALEAAGPGTLWLQTSTIGIAGAERCDALAAERKAVLVDAPVLGTKQPAEEAKLIALASGPHDARERTEALLEPLTQKVLWLGEAGAGQRLKVVVNAWIVALVEAAAETIALAEGIDVDPERFLEAVGGGPLDLPYLQMKGKAMIAREFQPAFKLRLAAKDAGLVEEAAERHGLDLPVLRAIAARLREGAGAHGDEDMAATFLTSAP